MNKSGVLLSNYMYEKSEQFRICTTVAPPRFTLMTSSVLQVIAGFHHQFSLCVKDQWALKVWALNLKTLPPVVTFNVTGVTQAQRLPACCSFVLSSFMHVIAWCIVYLYDFRCFMSVGDIHDCLKLCCFDIYPTKCAHCLYTDGDRCYSDGNDGDHDDDYSSCNTENRKHEEQSIVLCYLCGFQKVFKCDMCGAVRKNARNLSEHVRAIHFKIPKYQCDLCGEWFKWCVSVSRHKKKGLCPGLLAKGTPPQESRGQTQEQTGQETR